MRSQLTSLACATVLCAQAQQIDAYRYWYDDDAASAVTTTVTSTDELQLVDAWPTAGLAPGFHRVSVQVRDTNGDWSVPQTNNFTRGNQAIAGYRFWLNDNTADVATGTVAPDVEVNLNALIDPGTLTKDHNTVTIQFHDTDGEWSVPQLAVFVKNTGAVNGYEYWIDDDIAGRTTGTIGPAEVVDLIADLPTATTNGDHLFTIRFSGVNGTWSVPLSSTFSFFTGMQELPGIADLLLFPNPTDGLLSLRLTADGQKQMDLTVMDASGRQVAVVTNWSVVGTATRTIDLATLPTGPYALRIVDGERSAVLRFVKR